MRPTVNALRSIAARLWALLILLAPATACAADGASFRVTELAAEQRIVVEMQLTDGPVGTARVPVLRTALVHRVLAELVDAEGRPVAAPFVLRVRGGAGAPAGLALLHLTEAHAAFALPRQYGVPIEAGDSLEVAAALPQRTDAALRITLEYELPGEGNARLPVLAIAATVADVRPRGRVHADEAEWTVRPAADGMLLALTGRQVREAEELVMEDVATGAVLWRQRTVGAPAGVQRGEIVRPALRVQEGRSYRLRVRFASEAQRQAMMEDDAPLALMLPPLR